MTDQFNILDFAPGSELWPEARNLNSRGILSPLITTVDTVTETIGANTILYVPFLLNKSITVTSISMQVNTPDAGDPRVQVGIYDINNNGNPNNLLARTGDIDVTTTGLKTISLLNNVVLSANIYAVGLGSASGIPGFVGTGNDGKANNFFGRSNTNMQGVQTLSESLSGGWTELPSIAGGSFTETTNDHIRFSLISA